MKNEQAGARWPRVLVTGATGYLGSAAADALARESVHVVRGARSPRTETSNDWIAYGDLGEDHDLAPAVGGCDIVVHFAGMAHVPARADAAVRAAAVNVEGTRRLAAAAARAGAGRFVYIGSAQVHGADSRNGPIRENDAPRPADVYAASKLEAERRLLDICETSGMAFTILRPPMVYGPNSPGNFQRLVKLAASRLPLPLGCATAEKSFIAVDNLSSAVVRAALDPRAANQTFLVSDSETVSTVELAAKIAAILGHPPRTLAVPETLMRGLGRATGRSRDIARLFDPFVIDSARIRETLGWTPPFTLDEGLARAVAPQSKIQGRS